MKKMMLLFTVLALHYSNNIQSQSVIALTTSTGQTSVHSLFETALSQAKNGDYIYLPGGTFNLTSPIRKEISIIGAGHYPDSTVYSNRTIIEGNINIGAGASNAVLEGLYVIGNINFIAGEKTENVLIRRCNINNIIIGNSFTRNDTARCYNPLILHNVIRSNISFSETKGFTLKGNIIAGAAQACIYHGGLIENNIFLSVGQRVTVSDLRNVTFKNNIFMNTESLGWQGYSCYGYDGICGTYNCSFMNNLFVGKDSTLNIIPMAALKVGNQFMTAANSIFVNQYGTVFDYNQNYNLKPTAPGKNMGTDATDVGIYGTTDPYKASAVPSNPHFSYIEIPSSTLPNGTLQLKIKVNAQEK